VPPGSVKMAISFQYDSVIRGYHIYKEIWEASHGETFDCEVIIGLIRLL